VCIYVYACRRLCICVSVCARVRACLRGWMHVCIFLYEVDLRTYHPSVSAI
jgi:hypothetical protein